MNWLTHIEGILESILWLELMFSFSVKGVYLIQTLLLKSDAFTNVDKVLKKYVFLTLFVCSLLFSCFLNWVTEDINIGGKFNLKIIVSRKNSMQNYVTYMNDKGHLFQL